MDEDRMSWYPRATRFEIPESRSQRAIVPRLFIVHSIAAPWTSRRTGEFWRDSTNLESHFGIGFNEGDVSQYVDTEVRADANASANNFAVSVETASNLQHTDPWTEAQIAELILLGVWLHDEHDIPLRKARSWDDSGYGYHRMFPEWSVGGTACPGDARVRQFNDIIFPEIVRRANGVAPPPVLEEDDMVALGGEVKFGYDPVSTLVIVPSTPPGKQLFLNVGADMGDAVVRADVFTTSAGWKTLTLDTKVTAKGNLAFWPLPPDSRKLNIKRVMSADGPAVPLAWGIESK